MSESTDRRKAAPPPRRFGETRRSLGEGGPPARDQVRRTPDSTFEKVLCDRCNAEMFRTHAVWRCPACGYKTDCCGW